MFIIRDATFRSKDTLKCEAKRVRIKAKIKVPNCRVKCSAECVAFGPIFSFTQEEEKSAFEMAQRMTKDGDEDEISMRRGGTSEKG